MSTDGKKVIYSMIGVSKYYDRRPVLKDIALSYFYGAKIGVLGLNGSGKSSLLRIMAGDDTQYNGETILSDGYTVGFLPQEPLVNEDRTVREVVAEGAGEATALMDEFNRITEQLAEPLSDDEMDRLITRQGEVQEKLDALDAWDLDARLEMAMEALRCPPGEMSVSRCADCVSRPRTFSSWTSPPIIWMPNQWPGSSSTSSGIRGRSSR